MLNGYALNTVVLNGAGEPPEPVLIGAGLLIAFEQDVVEQITGEGLLIAFEQRVGLTGSGALITIEQDVILRITGSGQLIEIGQSVGASGQGRLIVFEQDIVAPSAAIPPHLERTDWDVTILLGGVMVSRDQIHGIITVERTESAAAIASFTLVYQPGSGLQVVEALAGKSVTIDIRVTAGIHRIFTGIVDVPVIDLIQKKITLNCTDRRLELINAQLKGSLPGIGFYSKIIFPEAKDTAEELEQRLTTIPWAVDFDAFGNYSFVPLRAKASADFTLPDSQVYDRQPSVSYTSRAQVTNTIDIDFKYRFPRLHHVERKFTWTSPITQSLCLVLTEGYTLAQRNMIAGAVDSTPWVVRGKINYTEIQPGGVYRCGSLTPPIIWSTIQYSGSTSSKVDESGAPVLDTKGNQQTETRITGGTDFRAVFANGANWQYTFRWVQTVVEGYGLKVIAPQSVSQYGPVSSTNQYSAEDDADTSQWENYKEYDNPYNQSAPTYHIDLATKRIDVNAAILTALNIAKTTILNSHRDTQVTFTRFIWPQIDLKHTVALSTGILNAQGKAFNIRHEINNGTTEAKTTVVLALSRALGSGTNSPLTVPAVPIDNVNLPTGDVVLGNHYGVDPATAPDIDTWSGRVGNKKVGGLATQYAEQFIVKTPTIDKALTDDKDKTVAAIYQVAIPNDLLEVVF